MKYHVVLHRETDLSTQNEQANQGECPRHVMWQLAQRLEAKIHTPHPHLSITNQDYFGSKVLGTPQNWALAREVVDQAQPEDVIFCNSEVSGLPIAALCRDRPNPPQVAVFVHNLDRPRGRAALWLTRAATSVNWFAACSQHQIDFLRKHLNLPTEKATFVWDQTDLRFFSPGAPSAPNQRPLIMSVGLEQRDYHTLAAATADLAVDVKISGFSEDAKALSKAFPKVMPENMSRQYYSWKDLLQLYRTADVVVVSTFPNRYAAGVQVMMEAMACGRPTVVTRTEGLQAYLVGHQGVLQVPPGDATAMREAIMRILEQREVAAQLSQQALTIAQQRHDSDLFVETLAQGLANLSQTADRQALDLVSKAM